MVAAPKTAQQDAATLGAMLEQLRLENAELKNMLAKMKAAEAKQSQKQDA